MYLFVRVERFILHQKKYVAFFRPLLATDITNDISMDTSFHELGIFSFANKCLFFVLFVFFVYSSEAPMIMGLTTPKIAHSP